MKKTILMLLVAITMGVSVVAQKFEVIWETVFDNYFEYYEEWPDDMGYGPPGIYYLRKINDKMYAFSMSSSSWFEVKVPYEIKKNYGNGYIRGFNNNKSSYFLRNGEIRIYLEDFEYEKYDYLLKIEEGIYLKDYETIYYTEDMVFFQTNNDKLISWKLLGEGKSEYYNAEKTEELLEEGLAEKVGLTTNARRTNFFFGEFNATSGSGPNYSKIKEELTIKTPGYDEYEGVLGFHYIGTDKTGLSYYWGYKYNGVTVAIRDPYNPIEVLIAVLDPWEKEVNIIELPAGDWDPERRAGGLIARCSQCIDEEGNVYFTDCSKEKGVYQIKKLTNTWSKELGYSERKIGRMTANRIPLYEKKDTRSENNGYNYEHEYLWVLESGKKWSKVRKVDGREGYVETRYIRFN